ncbi:hypothetical protein UA08_07001 [Talaromyces atroroseus]|uniref:Uncharacterized protein n=1 Tax=Talaromyces atroroseus TaxID=1441469 RepID=A0A225AKK6_TALAT|nr:hypothetical protein UA08_07001 [Talaromyces atroroseus]OKL57758.1 hypothetical protein UA08_07001 [Talaromyces atroroseus]
MELSYTLSHELGTMFGFLAACILTVGGYYIIWQALQRRAAARDEARRKDLHARGFHHERGGYHDKALHRYASRDPIAQSQGQTLEFLTEPAQYPGMMMTSSADDQASSSNSNNNNNYDKNHSYANAKSERDVGVLPWNRFTDYQEQHYGNNGAGLRIDSAVRNQKNQIDSAVSDETPSTIHEIGNWAEYK